MIALEPQENCLRILHLLYGRRSNFTLLANVLAARPGRLELLVSRRTPTVSTLSPTWAQRVGEHTGFARVRWDARQPVAAITLDGLIAEYGLPAFCKLDIEGFELEALKGLSRPIPALSLEYVPAAMQVALECIDHLSALAPYTFNFIHGEYPRLALDRWIGPGEAKSVLQSIRASARAGEVYARWEQR